MSRTIETIMAHIAQLKRRSMPTHAKRLMANWQNGFESGTHVQRKLRLGFTNVAAHSPAN
jgi:hypothetical protein